MFQPTYKGPRIERPEGDIFAPEQIFITPEWCRVLKDFEKAMLRKAQGASEHELLLACQEWWAAADALDRARKERERAWLEEYTGRKGAIHELFDKLDVDGNGELCTAELQLIFDELPNFFGFTAAPTAGAAPGAEGDDQSAEQLFLAEEAEAGHLGASALFASLDRNADGKVSWEEFWDVIDAWLKDGFDRVDEPQRAAADDTDGDAGESRRQETA